MTHISKRDYTTRNRRTYSFEASWQPTETGVSWDATIWRNGQLVGNQSGLVSGEANAATSDVVASRIRAVIEAGVEGPESRERASGGYRRR